MKFAEWLEATMPVVRLSFFRDGTVVAYINNQRYVYITDAVYHNRWRKIAKYRPMSVINDIKDMVQRGLATQEEPKLGQVQQF